MSIGFLLDENLPKWWPQALRHRHPALTIWAVGEPGAPALQTPDGVLLTWCDQNRFYLVTNNRKSMPKHLADHVRQGTHVPGVIVVPASFDINELGQELVLIEGAALEDEFQDQIQFLPLT